MIVVTLVLITLQIVLGEIVGAAATYPTTGMAITSIGQLISVMNSTAGVVLFVHVAVGILILIAAIGTAMIARRYHKPAETRAVGLGILCIILALIGGYIFAASDFQNGLGIILMVNAAIVAYAMLFIALYYTKP